MYHPNRLQGLMTQTNGCAGDENGTEPARAHRYVHIMLLKSLPRSVIMIYVSAYLLSSSVDGDEVVDSIMYISEFG